MPSTTNVIIFAVVPIFLLTPGVNGFGVLGLQQSRSPSLRFQISPFARVERTTTTTSALYADGEKDDESIGKGMEDAFKQLDNLKSLDDDVFTVPDRKVQDEAFAKAMETLDLKGLEDVEPPPPEAEAALYSDMASELASASEIDLIDDVKSQLGGVKTEIPKFDPASRDTEKFLEKALTEAIEEASAMADVDKESLLDNKEIMKEIKAIFDRANDELLDGLEDIRKEQMALAESSAERNSQATQDRIREDEERLAAADANMKKMLAKVNVEAKNVEEAINDLRAAQQEIDGGMDSQLIDLKKGGLLKQSILVGALLFSLRAVSDGIAFASGDSTHLLPALIQGGIALLCLAILIFTK
ncbi:unnamed protein product [Cylindrotheca closterium]|uniref:Uncharacterized protein n=1 Tax=Cylindrotheca closterium TaxID=2856 RepID=A0AAD2PW86_9STRA|nr:unnamed protein product [Cylindrotheca closterium]